MRSGGNGRTGNVFKFMAAFKTPSASGRGLQRATAAEGNGTFERGEELEEGIRGGGDRVAVEGEGGFCLMHSDA